MTEPTLPTETRRVDPETTTLWGEYRAAATFTFDLDAELLWHAVDEHEPGFERFAFRGTYGPKVGVPRILDVFEKHDCRATFFVPGMVAEEWPGVVTEIHDRGHEIAHHTYSHQHPRHMTDAEERAEFEETIAVFEDLLGERPSGYRGGHSPQTLAVAVENGLSYDASLMDDDLPYLLPEDDLVEIPNDFLLDDFVFWGFNMHPTFAAQSGITPTEPVFETWRAEFDALYRRGRQFVLTMHPQITGRASRIDALDDLLAHVTGTGDTWVATCREVAQHWREHYDG